MSLVIASHPQKTVAVLSRLTVVCRCVISIFAGLTMIPSFETMCLKYFTFDVAKMFFPLIVFLNLLFEDLWSLGRGYVDVRWMLWTLSAH